MGQISVWIPEDSDVLERFENALGYGDTRSGAIVAAMELFIDIRGSHGGVDEATDALELAEYIDETLAELDIKFNSPVEKRHWIRQAMRSELERSEELTG